MHGDETQTNPYDNEIYGYGIIHDSRIKSTFDFINANNPTIEEDNVHAISISLGAAGKIFRLEGKLNNAMDDKNVIIVAQGGERSGPLSVMEHPAKYDRVIAVGGYKFVDGDNLSDRSMIWWESEDCPPPSFKVAHVFDGTAHPLKKEGAHVERVGNDSALRSELKNQYEKGAGGLDTIESRAAAIEQLDVLQEILFSE
jgi:subtilisin family serine protease